MDNSNSVDSTVVIKLNYLNAKDFAPTLTTLATASLGKEAAGQKIAIMAEEEQNSLLIQAPASTVQRIKSLVKQLDHRPGQVLVQAIIAKVDESSLSNLGVVWGNLQAVCQRVLLIQLMQAQRVLP